jgi:hypothetical protein
METFPYTQSLARHDLPGVFWDMTSRQGALVDRSSARHAEGIHHYHGQLDHFS